MTELRRDALRNRDRILAAARALPRGDLRLNDVARRADVGVGTVYRHFPTTHALVEALAAETLLRMRDVTRAAETEADAGIGLERLLAAALELQLEEGGLQSVLLSDKDETDEVRQAKREILTAWEGVLARAKDTGAVRADIDAPRLQRLICGVEHAARLGPREDRAVLLGVLLRGIRA